MEEICISSVEMVYLLNKTLKNILTNDSISIRMLKYVVCICI